MPEVYVRTGSRYGLNTTVSALAERLGDAFAAAPGIAPPPNVNAGRYEYDWWKSIAARAFDCPDDDIRIMACFDELFHYYASTEAWRIHDELPELLQALQGDGLKLGICSNFDGRLNRILDAFGLTLYFDYIALPRDAGFQKPDVEIFHYLAAQLGVKASAVLHFGDDIHEDIEAARHAGLQACHWMLPPDADINLARKDLRDVLHAFQTDH